MSVVIKVGMADYKVGRGPDKLLTLGLGSCIGVTLYDKRKKQGGMAHIMLPKNPTPDKPTNRTEVPPLLSFSRISFIPSITLIPLSR